MVLSQMSGEGCRIRDIMSTNKLESRCKECGGEVILIEGWSLDAVGYGYGTFECLDCKKESSYYGEGLITIEVEEKNGR